MDDRRTLHLTFAPQHPGAPEPTRNTRSTDIPGATEPIGATVPEVTANPRDLTASATATDLPTPRRTPRDRVLVLAEHLVGSWATTLRMALVMLACMLGSLVLLALTVGPLPALIAGGALAAVISTSRNR